jgi:radical SAM superfamily enzyme YgiQ (UPF0313 family)
MRIYLADLFHTNKDIYNADTAPYTVPLGIGYLAATLKKRVPGVEVSLFRDPSQFIQKVRALPPDLVGLSMTSWNSDLSRRAALMVKRIVPHVPIMAGGPCVDDQDSAIIDFLRAQPFLDYLIPSEGENGTAALVQHLDGRRKDGEIIPGVAYLSSEGKLVRGRYCMPKPEGEAASLDSEIPSPYLTGILDSFLDQNLIPIIQTMRGCPYRCDFCVSGANAWDKLRGFDLDRVKAEINYAMARSSTSDLILTDENWGILGGRDIEIADHILKLRRDHGKPARLYYYTTKIVTDTSRTIVEMVAPIAWIGEFTMSFQSLNPETRKAIRRTNITMDKLAANIEWANERNIITSSEMIYGFPYETPDSFFSGIETLLNAGMHRVTVYPLQLFPGIELDKKEVREKYGLKTMFRMADSAYGNYCDGKLTSLETEELVTETNTSTFDDYFTVRRYSFFMQALLGRLLFVELFKLGNVAKENAISVIRHLARLDYAAYPALQQILDSHKFEARDELKASRDEVFQSIADRVEAGQIFGGVKLNLVYVAKLLSSEQAVGELLDIVSKYFQQTIHSEEAREIILTYVEEILPNRIAILQKGAPKKLEFSARFDYQKWQSNQYSRLSDLLTPTPKTFTSTLSDVLQANLEDFQPENRASLQGILDKTPKRQLLRAVS